MSAPDFLDSNVLIYAYQKTDRTKQSIAQKIVSRAQAGEFLISTQVLAEFSATLLYKMSPRANPKDVLQILRVLSPIRVLSPDSDTIHRAVEAHSTYGVHFYDGMIIAAAERAGCERIWSEDLSSSQTYFGIKVVNPFGSTKVTV